MKSKMRLLLATSLLVFVQFSWALTVSITAPANNATFTPPASIAITASVAPDQGYSVSKVEFFQGATLLGTATTAPFTLTWSNISTGSYVLTAKATTTKKNDPDRTATSAAISVVVNSPPSITLISPVDGRIYGTPPGVTASANASDSDGTVSVVGFEWTDSEGTTNSISVSQPPYTAVLPIQVNCGSSRCDYFVRAFAADNLGGITYATAAPNFSVQENSAPTISITSPSSNTSYSAPATISIQTNAQDSDGSISKVEFYSGSNLLSTATSAPYGFDWTNVPAGTYTITAKAFDNFSATTTSTAITVLVNAPPTVAITNPANNATFKSPANIFLAADASDNDGTIASVSFYYGNTLITTLTSAPYSFTWSNVPQGTYSLTAIAIDNSGSATTSTAINVTVNTGVTKLYFIEVDHLNTPRLVSNDQAQTVWQWDQDEPFGATVPNESVSGQMFEFPLRFPGQYADKETNTAQNVFRDYDPAIGRYLQSDLIGLRGGVNTYGYGFSDPLIYIDQNGLFCIPANIIKLIAATGGGTASGAVQGRSWQAALFGGLIGGGLELIGQASGWNDNAGGVTGIGAASGFLNEPGNVKARALGGLVGGYTGLVQSQSPGQLQNTTAGGFGGLVGTIAAEGFRPQPSILRVGKGGAAGLAGGITQDALERLLTELYGCDKKKKCH